MNIFVGLIWILLTSKPTSINFTIGLLIGYLLISFYNSIFREGFYLRRSIGIVLFIFTFLKAFIISNLQIAWAILFRSKKDIHPHIISLPIDDMSEFEIYFLTHCITLTPGTTSVSISKGFKKLYIHAFDGQNPDAVKQSIINDLKTPILRMTR